MARFGTKEVANFTLYNLLTGEPELFLDTLKLSSLENASEEVFANGGSGNARLVGWDFNRTANFTVQNALLDPKAISMQLGTELENKVETIYMREVLYGDVAGKVTLSQTPDEGSVKVYPSEDGYKLGTKVASPTVEGKDVTDISVADKQVVVFYTAQSSAETEVITVSSDKFGGFYRAVGDTFWRNEATGQDEVVQIVVPKVKISSTFNLAMQPDGEPAVFDFNLAVFKDTKSTDMVKLVRYNF